MKINYIGIVAGVMAFISLILPWWTMTMSAEYMGVKASGDIIVYTYDARWTVEVNGFRESESAPMDIWYAYAALALMIGVGVAGIVGSLMVGKDGKVILVVAGILALLSIIIFAVGLQIDLSQEIEPGYPKFGLFSRGSFNEPEFGIPFDFSTYLTFGFWLALAAGLVALVASDRHPMAPPEAPPPPQEPLGAPAPSPPPPTPKPTAPPKIHCVHCGAENPPHADFCLKCGKKMVKP